MRVVPAAMTEAFNAEDKTGDRRPTVRATIQKAHLLRFNYDTELAPGGVFQHDRARRGGFRSIVMGSDDTILELPNILSCDWTRSVNQDVAECTIRLLNSEVIPIGAAPEEGPSHFEKLGAYSFSRGAAGDDNPWGYPGDNSWNGMLVPDRMVKTYEGYGADYSVWPSHDTNLMPSGAWLIDTVTYGADGVIELRMRDIGRILIDHIVFPPAVPIQEYPLSWSKIKTENLPGRDVTGGSWQALTKADGEAESSNYHYVGEGLSNPPYPHYVTNNEGFNGHHPNHVLENGDGYWLSTGQTSFDSKVYWEMDFDGSRPISGVRIKTYGGPYRVYISIHNGNRWVGRKKIPYTVTTEGIDIGAGIRYIASATADKNRTFDVILPRVINNATHLRITFTRLMDTEVGDYPYRAGLRDVRIYTGTANNLDFASGNVLRTVGNYADYTDIVKWVTAWCGFFWPEHSTGQDYILAAGEGGSDTKKEFATFVAPDPVLPRGRVWGDFMNTGTAGVADLTADLFDKQPLMDVINYVRDVCGYNFWIDETGGVVWRMPNLWSLGNYVSPTTFQDRTARTRTSTIITLDDEQHLLSYRTTLNSKNLRERIFVGDARGKTGVVVKGYIPINVGFRRVAGWTDQHFDDLNDCLVMADLIAARQQFDYRRGHLTIAGYPAIQADDQIKILERVTNEYYYHYVESIHSSIDMQTGVWTYDLETHWLGRDPEDAWVVNPTILQNPTKNYLAEMGVTT